ncbi:hypothetical protein SDC9_169040 [bioreactor metagenome]|uniref:Uncharacterized protein n=1 Tax=bioreactor metagenome TaxID=1076179 RepID=A0A645G6R5_9ZZZZ
MVKAAELAVVLGQVVVARGEAARGIRQRQAAVGEDLGFHASRGAGQNRRQCSARHLHRRQPAFCAQPGQHIEGFRIVDVEGVPGDERRARFGQQAHRAPLVGFDAKAAVGDHAAQRLEIGFRFDQRLAGQHHVLAGSGKLLRQRQPVGQAQQVTTRAHALAQVHARNRPGFRFLVEGEHVVARPVIEQGTQTQIHGSLISRDDGRHRACGSAPPTAC